MIVSRKPPPEIYISKIIGAMAYIVIIVITFVLYFTVKANFDE